MNTVMLDLLSDPWVQRAGWALVHFVWQGAVVALLLMGVLHLLPRRSPQARWAAACAALALMAALPAVTVWWMLPEGGPTEARAVSAMPLGTNSSPEPPPSVEVRHPRIPAPATAGQAPPIGFQAGPVAETTSWAGRAEEFLRPAIPWGFLAWLVGVVGMSLWHLGGWSLLQWTKRRHTRPASPAARDVLDRLIARFRISRSVRLLESARVAVPLVIGWLRPVILVPASALTGLAPLQLEAVLAHELAHIRRLDSLVKLLQAVVETALFYHPAVWWVSGRIRQECEHCCDDMALEACRSTGWLS
jgi:Zn-dependent protease with chaperone function